jgi:hypothetical protein
MIIKEYLHRFFWFFLNHTHKLWPDALWLKVLYRAKLHRKLNLKNPIRFTEKLNWLKLHDHNPMYTNLVDKYEVKNIIKEMFGDQMVIPLYGVWEHFDDIDFDNLPNQFVLKCTHDSGRFCICKDKEKFDFKKAKEKIELSLNNNFYWWTREWPYKHVKPRIIAEKYMTDNECDALTDYKFFCFNGVPKMMYISKDVSADPRTDFFDMEWNHLPLRLKDPNADTVPLKPKLFDEMKNIATRLSRGIPHVRVDLYVINEQIYFGEMTFFHNSGIFSVTPDEWDYIMGEWLELPKIS